MRVVLAFLTAATIRSNYNVARDPASSYLRGQTATNQQLPFPNARGGDENLANHIPGYGGGFIQNGDLIIHLINLRDSLSALAEATLAVGPRRAIKNIKFVKGDFTYVQLRNFIRILGNSGALNNVVGDGVDGKSNRARLTFRTSEEINRAKQIIRKLGLPLDAFIFEIGEPARVL